MAGDRTEALETGDAQVSRGTRGETKQDWYAGTDTGDAHVGGLSRAKARQAVLEDRSGGGISRVSKSNDGSR